eukprot:scaffold50_cov420-Prasinococcus_capsulatus_cf.AAC.36
MPVSEMNSRTLSSYTRARSAPKKSMDWPGKVSTSVSTSERLTPSLWKIPQAMPMRSSRWGVESGEVISGSDDRHARDLVILVNAWQLYVGRVVGDVHECSVHHLVVHCILCGPTHTARARVQIIDEQRAHLALGDDICGLSVALTHELCGLARVARLQFSRRHCDRVDTQLGERELRLERLTLALASPDAQDEGDLHLGQLHEVLRNVDRELVQERGGNVETGVGQLGQVRTAVTLVYVGSVRAHLELLVHHFLASLLVYVVVKLHGLPLASPSRLQARSHQTGKRGAARGSLLKEGGLHDEGAPALLTMHTVGVRERLATVTQEDLRSLSCCGATTAVAVRRGAVANIWQELLYAPAVIPTRAYMSVSSSRSGARAAVASRAVRREGLGAKAAATRPSRRLVQRHRSAAARTCAPDAAPPTPADATCRASLRAARCRGAVAELSRSCARRTRGGCAALRRTALRCGARGGGPADKGDVGSLSARLYTRTIPYNPYI